MMWSTYNPVIFFVDYVGGWSEEVVLGWVVARDESLVWVSLML